MQTSQTQLKVHYLQNLFIDLVVQSRQVAIPSNIEYFKYL